MFQNFLYLFKFSSDNPPRLPTHSRDTRRIFLNIPNMIGNFSRYAMKQHTEQKFNGAS